MFFKYLKCAHCIRECLKYVYCIRVRISTFVRRKYVAITRDQFRTLFKIVQVFFMYLKYTRYIRDCLKHVYCIHEWVLKYIYCIRECLKCVYCIRECVRIRAFYSWASIRFVVAMEDRKGSKLHGVIYEW